MTDARPAGPITRWREADRSERAWWVGLLGVALLLAGSGWYQAFAIPPYRYTDEQAHIGYVLELQKGDLPTIVTPIDGSTGGPELQERLEFTANRHGDVWVANNPPTAYVVDIIPAAMTRALGWPGGPLVGMRLTNLVFFVASALLLAKLATELTGDRRAGLIAAATFAAIPHVPMIAGTAYNDGLGLLCSIGMFEVLVRMSRRGPTRRQVLLLSVWCAIGAGVRPMTAVLAGVTAAMAVAIAAWRALQARRTAVADEGGPDADETTAPAAEGGRWHLGRRAGILWSMVVLAVPVLLLDAGWYLRSQHLYGDPTGSKFLFEKFGRVPRDGVLSIIHADSVWRESTRTLFTRRIENELPTDPLGWWPWIKGGLIALLLAAVVTIVADQVRARRNGRPPRTPALGWACMAVATGVVILLSAQHWAGGGTVHARYLFPALAILVVAMALPVVRYLSRWGGVAMVLLFVAIQARMTPKANEYLFSKIVGHPGSALMNPIGPTWFRMLGIAAMLAGLVTFAVALAFVDGPDQAAPSVEDAGERAEPTT